MNTLTVNPVLRTNYFLQRGVGLRGELHRLVEARRACREEHELLGRKPVTRVPAAVDHVQPGHRESVRRLHTGEVCEVLVERHALLACTGHRDRHGHADDGVRAELRLVRRPIELDEEVVDVLLGGDLQARLDECRCDDVIDVREGLRDTWLNVGHEL